MDALTEADVQKCLQMCVQLRAIIEEGIKKASEFQDKGRTCKSKSNGDVGKAIEFFRKQLKICEEVFYQVGVMEARTNLGNAYYDIGQYQNAIDCHRKVLEIAEERRDKHNAGVAYGNLANMYDSIGQYQMAIDCQQKALEIVKELGDRPGMGIILGNMGNSFKAIGQYQKAIDHYGEALKIAEEIGDKEGLCMTYTNIGSAYSSIGQYQKDIDYQLKALEIAKEIKHTADAGSAYGNLGSAYYSIGRYKEALNCHMENKTIAERLGNKPEVGRAYGNLGNVYLKMGDCQKALDYHSKDLEIAQELGDSQGIATARGNKGNALLASGKFQSAIECYKKQLISCEEIGDIPGVARTQLSLGLTYQWNDSKLACSHFAKSLLSFHRIRRSAVYPDESNTSLSNTFAGVHKRLVKSLLNLKKVKAALLVSDSGKAKALCDLTKRSVDVVMDSALDDKYTIPIQAISDNPCSTTTETLLDEVLSDVIRLMQDGSIISFSFDDLRGLHTWVISREGVCHKQWQTYNRMLGETYLKTIVDELQQSLVRKVPENFSAYPEEGKVPEFSDIDRKQGQEHTYVPVNNRDFSAKKCLDRYNLDNASRSQCSPYHSCAQEGEENQRNIQKLCGYFSLDVPDTARSSINRGSKLGTSLPKEYTPVDVYLQKLHSILIAPIEKYLIGSKVLIVPEGPLFRLPFSALLSPKEDRLCDTYSLQFTPALHVLNFCLSKPLPKLGPAMFVGNPAVGEVQFGNKRVLVPPLPNAAVEAKACSEYFTARPMLDENATKANVLKNMKHASVIHIAAHGHMDYADIFLAPNDGAPKPPSEEYYLLTAQDVVQCTLSARLVVLSCCHSGCGQVSAEGVVGIARSFLGAGARSVLVTLWQIPDKETMEFMRLFYDKVLQGLSVCVALQQAMLDLKKKYSISNWAPFQIAGEDICLSKDDIEEIRRQSSIR